MMFFQIFIFGIFIGFILCFFYFKNKSIRKEHEIYISGLEEKLQQHQFQMKFRNDSLQRYDFLKYNIQDSLVVQLDVKI